MMREYVGPSYKSGSGSPTLQPHLFSAALFAGHKVSAYARLGRAAQSHWREQGCRHIAPITIIFPSERGGCDAAFGEG